MIHMVACNTRDCPWRRCKAFGCLHPDGVGKVTTRKSLDAAVPEKCPLRKTPDILVAPPPAGGVLAPAVHVERVVAQCTTHLQQWLELAHTVHARKENT